MINNRLCHILFFILFYSNCYSQEVLPIDKTTKPAYINSQMSIAVSYSKNILIPYQRLEDRLAVNQIRGVNAQVLYGINDWLELGIALDVCYKKKLLMKGWTYPNYILPTFQCRLGETAKAHLLSIFWPKFSLIDFYVSEFVGISSTFSTDGWPDTRYSFYAQVGIGSQINFSRHFGLFYEFGINHNRNHYSLFGLNIRFNGPKKWQK